MQDSGLFLLLKPVILILLAVLTASCGSTRTSSPANIESRLMQQYQNWQGTPYQWGGQSRSGVDCSAFIMIMYRDALGVNLPRTTESQMRAGNRISRQRLRVGDLVFFRTGRRTLHVGIVLSRGRMMHASTSNGVTIDNLNGAYWRRNFIGARRVL